MTRSKVIHYINTSVLIYRTSFQLKMVGIKMMWILLAAMVSHLKTFIFTIIAFSHMQNTLGMCMQPCLSVNTAVIEQAWVFATKKLSRPTHFYRCNLLQRKILNREKKKSHFKINFHINPCLQRSVENTSNAQDLGRAENWGWCLFLDFGGHTDPIHEATEVETFFTCRSRQRRPVFFNHTFTWH